MLRRKSVMTAALGLMVLGAGPGLAQEPRQVESEPGSLLQPTRGSLAFESENLDLGLVHDGNKIDVEWPFVNEGESPVTIIKARPSCGCTVPKGIENLVVQPGEESVVRASFNPTGKKGQTSVRVTLETDDPERAVVTLSLSAEVESIVSVDPVLVQFGELMKGETKTLTIDLTGQMEDLEALFATSTDSTVVDARVLGVEKVEINGRERQKSTLEVIAKAPKKTGQIRERLFIRTNDPRRRLVEVNVLGRIVGELKATPDRLGLGLIVPGQEFIKTTTITNRAGTPFEILDATVELDGFRPGEMDIAVEVIPAADAAQGTSYEVILTGNPPESSVQRRPVRGKLLVKTDVEGEQVLDIMLYGSMRSVPAVPRQAPQPARPARPSPAGPADGGGG